MMRKPEKDPEVEVLRRQLQISRQKEADLQSQIEDLNRAKVQLEDEVTVLRHKAATTDNPKHHEKPLSDEAEHLLSTAVNVGLQVSPIWAIGEFGWAPIQIHAAFDELVQCDYFRKVKEGAIPMHDVYQATSKGIQHAARPKSN